jgi:hypothetical protein
MDGAIMIVASPACGRRKFGALSSPLAGDSASNKFNIFVFGTLLNKRKRRV